MKATHTGLCQWCEARHKLPRGRLAKHGYTVRNHWFEGVCAGSDELPYELSCDLIQASIDAAKEQREHCLVKIAKTEAIVPVVERKAWLYVYRPDLSSRKIGPVYRWEQHELTQQANGTWIYRDPRGLPQKCPHHGTLEQIVAKGKAAYLAHLRSGLEDIKAYIQRQRQRIKEWKVRPLERVDAR